MKPSFYLPGLDGLRAIAAMVVMIFHTDQYSHYFGLESYGFWKTNMQAYAVILFFVLSGFLITFLLQKEKDKSGKVNIRYFYIRRILRTWPVYYLALTIGIILLFLLPAQINQGINHHLLITGLAYGFLVPNVAAYLGYAPHLINILWSVGAEEQFYAIWPWIVNNSNKLLGAILLFLLGFLAVKYLLTWLRFPPGALFFMNYLAFDCMAIGGIAACLYRQNSRLFKIVYNPATQVIAWLFFAVSICYHPLRIKFLGMLNTDLHAVVYAIIILNVSTNSKTLLSLENKFLAFLGKISYGIYGYHFIILFLLSLCMKNFFTILPAVPAHIIMFISEITTTCLLAYLSRRYFEGWFLNKKVQYEMPGMPGTDRQRLNKNEITCQSLNE